MSTHLSTNTNDVCAPAVRLCATVRTTTARMTCSACHRPLMRAAFTVGHLNFGPVCFKKVLELGRKAKRVESRLMPTGDLLDGCLFDTQGEADRASLLVNTEIT